MTVAVHAALDAFNRGEDFLDHLHEDAVLEFPYGPTLGLPSRIVGRDAVWTHLRTVQAGSLRLGEPVIGRTGKDTYVVEYTGTYRSNDRDVDIPLISIIDHNGTSITRIREYWDTLRIAELNSNT